MFVLSKEQCNGVYRKMLLFALIIFLFLYVNFQKVPPPFSILLLISFFLLYLKVESIHGMSYIFNDSFPFCILKFLFCSNSY